MPGPARAMSSAAAYARLRKLANEQVIRLAEPSTANGVLLDGLGPHTPGIIAGVRLHDTAGAPYRPGLLDPRNALALIRFTEFLRDNFGVTELLLDPGGHCAALRESHRTGRAIDVAGVVMRVGEVRRRITVADHWGGVATAATPGGDWPAHAGPPLRYRLDEPDAHPLGDPDGDMFVADFFRSVYDFAAGEWQDRSTGPDPAGLPTAIGEPSLIRHPDHPGCPVAPHRRRRYRTHLHLQIGGTE